MAILVVGSVRLTASKRRTASAENVLGGAATHFALAASYFTDVRVIGVVGEDFLPEHEAVLTNRGVDTRGIEHAPGLSFHWTGAYSGTLNEAQTLGTDLNVFENLRAQDSGGLRRQRVPLPRQHRPRAAGPRAQRRCRT